MYVLLACSVVTVTIAVERLIFWMRLRARSNAGDVERILGHVGAGDHAGAEQACGGSSDPIARVMKSGLEHRDDAVEAALHAAAGVEIRSMRKFLRVLDTTVTVAPLLGILGTVLGIISSFDVIGGGGIDDPLAVTGGVAEALLTTAAGLVVAIVALLPLNYFTARMEEYVSHMEDRLTTFQVMLAKGMERS